MSSPIKSKYQTDPWEPNVDKHSKDAKDQQKAADAYTTVYGGTPTYGPDPTDNTPPPPSVTMPDLAMAYTTAPDFLPSTPASSDAAQVGNSADDAPFNIDLGALRTCETQYLTALSNVQGQYETLKTTVTNAINNTNAFGQLAGQTEHHGFHNTASWVQDDLDQEGVNFAKEINPKMTQVLQSIASGVEAIGQFTALLNNAGQMYTETDFKSAMKKAS
ncbi:hypothetical protein K7472_19225 [Streptomyces sp. PTM05]|uniref:Uncharacterized protein n=1 Tax=Streptantibioticus parmotrematis TaxID=2873249 RepID=A0ABS7QUT2_9ACTN|nr:hypothetical protein [Streptantibioticus parmotrematis]MBY8886972.1 hypothetical protein [Streptantibioticus parmotrematis]